MIDPITNNANATIYSGLKKVNIDLLIKDQYGLINFHIALANYEILGAHLLKSDEWIYGLYSGWRYYGYLYLGKILTLEQQFSCVKDFLPKDYSALPEFEKNFKDRIDYYVSKPEAFHILIENSGRKFIKKSNNGK